jgi:hypothetical protein
MDAAQFVDDLAVGMAGMGFPRMPARVFALLLAADEETLTARELAERLEVSPAAISGAVRYLEQIRLLQRSRQRGERVDRFGLAPSIWGPVMESEVAAYAPLIALCDRALGGELPAAGRRRVTETRDFLAFMTEELPQMWQRFQSSRGR